MAVAFAVLLLSSATLVAVGVMGLMGRIPRNHVAGIRTSYTMASDERWFAVHRAAAPWMIFGGVALTSTSLAVFPFAVAGRIPDGFGATVATLLVAGTVLVAVIAALAGVRSARSQGL